jgi:methionine synthase I (cobalamin-dependent)
VACHLLKIHDRLSEEDYRGARFKDWHIFVQGNNDLLSLTQPKIIQDIIGTIIRNPLFTHFVIF